MKTLLLSLVCIFFSVQAFTQAFSIDQSFDPNFSFYGSFGYKGRLTALIKLDNNDIIVSGGFYFLKNNKYYGDFVRISQYGTLDESFNHIPVLTAIGKMFDRHDSLYAIQSMSRHFFDFDGNILSNTWQINSINDLDPNIEDIEFFADNSALVGGAGMLYEPDTTYQTRFNLTFLKPDGHVDTTFNHEPNDVVWDIVKYDEERVFLVGKFTQYDNTPIKRLCRIYNNGELDTTFHSSVIAGWPIPLFIQDDGKIIIGGYFWIEGDSIGLYSEYNARGLIRLTPEGTIDSSFNDIKFSGIPSYQTNTLCPSYDGGYLVGGSFTHFNGYPRKKIAKIDFNGNLDTTVFNGSGFDSIYQTNDYSGIMFITRGPNETYYVGGGFDRYNGLQVDPIVRLHNEFYSIDEPNFETQQIQLYPNPAKEIVVVSADFRIEKVEIFNISRSKVKELSINKSQKEIDVSGLVPGHYVARVVGKEEVSVKKFAIIR